MSEDEGWFALEQTPTNIRLTQISSDLAFLVKSLSDLMKIADAARTVVWQRYNTDPNNTFGNEFPDVSRAIFALGNLVGLSSGEDAVDTEDL